MANNLDDFRDSNPMPVLTRDHLYEANRDGMVYGYHHEVTLAGGQSAFFEIRVGSKIFNAVMRTITADGNCSVKIWKNATFTQGTTPFMMPPTALNDLVNVPATTQAFANPTNVNTSGAKLLAFDSFAIGKGSPTAYTSGIARIIAPNTPTLVEVINTSSQTNVVRYDVLFYERE